MRVTLKDGSVHKCSRVAFVCVTANILLTAVFYEVSCKLPFLTCGEARTASSAKSTVKDSFYNLVGSHFGKNLTECLISVCTYVLFNVFRVNNTAVTKSNSLLLLVEACVCKSNCFLVNNFFACISVNKSFNNSSFKEMFFYNFRYILSGNS